MGFSYLGHPALAANSGPQGSRPLLWTARVWQVRIGHAVAPLVTMEPGKVARIGQGASKHHRRRPTMPVRSIRRLRAAVGGVHHGLGRYNRALGR